MLNRGRTNNYYKDSAQCAFCCLGAAYPGIWKATGQVETEAEHNTLAIVLVLLTSCGGDHTSTIY